VRVFGRMLCSAVVNFLELAVMGGQSENLRYFQATFRAIHSRVHVVRLRPSSVLDRPWGGWLKRVLSAAISLKSFTRRQLFSRLALACLLPMPLKRSHDDFLSDEPKPLPQLADPSSSIMDAPQDSEPTDSMVCAAAQVLRVSQLASQLSQSIDDSMRTISVAGLDKCTNYAPLRAQLQQLSSHANALPSLVPLSRVSFSSLPSSIVLAAASHDITPLGPPFKLREKPSITDQEMNTIVTPAVARQTLLVQVEGCPGTGRGGHGTRPVLPAKTNFMGCWLSMGHQKINGGHIQVALRGVVGRHSAQLLHRLAVRAWKPAEDMEKLLTLQGYDVSHRCHKPNCFCPEHLVVETHQKNIARNACSRGLVRCACEPPCLLGLLK
jgi:hypothetical protein